MKFTLSRRQLLVGFGGVASWLMAQPIAQAAKTAVKKVFVSTQAPKGYDPFKHKWLMCIDADRCIGCGACVEACKTENHVPSESMYFRTWIERYIIKKPAAGSGDARGEVLVDSPNGGRGGFPPSMVPRTDILKAFFVPKLCNLCEKSPCTQACPVGATFDSPDGAVLVDPNYCIGCGFCIQACPYGCRFLNPETHTADKCSLCYHRITRELKPACVEVCPGQARIFGDLKNPVENDPLQAFIRKNKVQALKPNLGTDPRVLYANIDKEVR
ncbi:MAG: 4Fe-4S dicluster domain-containing protein [Opitutae bacterium]|nr:4Fe-4S dicluster domain-containing protein [Opitutae bacterium]